MRLQIPEGSGTTPERGFGTLQIGVWHCARTRGMSVKSGCKQNAPRAPTATTRCQTPNHARSRTSTGWTI
eukprot:15472702-Alexandrium_andersonii.AAC.1